jgi:hypothetical protein
MRQMNKIMQCRWCYLLTNVWNLALRSKTQRRIEVLRMFNQKLTRFVACGYWSQSGDA